MSAAPSSDARHLAGSCICCYRLGYGDSLIRVWGTKAFLIRIYRDRLKMGKNVAGRMARETPPAVLAARGVHICICEPCAAQNNLPRPHSRFSAPGVPTVMAGRSGEVVFVVAEFEITPMLGRAVWPEH